MSSLEKELEKSGLTLKEFKALLRQNSQQDFKPVKFDGELVRYGIISDSHIGHKCYRPEIMESASRMFKKRKVDFVLHGGDVVEGHYESRRQGSIFDLNIIGGDNQVEASVRELKQIESPIYMITGNHCWNTFWKMCGFDIGKQIARELPNLTYLGNMEGFVELPFGHRIELLHPDGGSAYAISYKSQKIAESLDGGHKPAILHIGHFHKAEYIFYRNIHIVQNGTLCSQTPFMKGKHISAHMGFWIIEARINQQGVSKIKSEFYPFY